MNQITPESEKDYQKAVTSLSSKMDNLLINSPEKPSSINQVFYNKLKEGETLGQNCNSPSMLLQQFSLQRRNSYQIVSNLFSVLNSPLTPIPIIKIDKISPIQWLKDKGYDILALKLEDKEGYPWDEIKEIKNPVLIEQLINLYLLSDNKFSNSENKDENINSILRFALYFARLTTFPITSSQAGIDKTTENTKQILGQLIYLVNRNIDFIIECFNSPSYSLILEKIENQFNNEIKTVCDSLYHYYNLHKHTLLQDPEIALSIKISLEIAKALLTDNGTINIGIIDSLSLIFLPQNRDPLNYEIRIAYGFKALQYSSVLRYQFEEISIPISNYIPSNDIIRITLDLPFLYQVTKNDVRLAILVGFLSHLRQGNDKGCFAVSLASEILSSHLGLYIKDIKQLLEKGKLTRSINGIYKDIPFFKRISDENFHKKITFDQAGCLVIENKLSAFLWEAPGIIAVCQSTDLPDPQSVILAIIKEHFSNKDFITLTIKEIISKICEYKFKLNQFDFSTIKDIYSQACFAFSSKTTQPILKIWENTIANMAEAEKKSMIKTAVLESTLDALQFKLGVLNVPRSIILQRFFLLFQKKLYESIQPYYDPALNNTKRGSFDISNDQETNCSSGGFKLCNTKNDQYIDNETAFKHFIDDTLLEAKNELNTNNSAEKTTLENTYTILSSYLLTDQFLIYLLIRYHSDNKKAITQMGQKYLIDYKILQYTPWITLIGNNSKALLKIYFEDNKDIPIERFIPHSAEEALIYLIDMCKRMSTNDKNTYLNNPNKLTSFRILNKHSSPLMIGSPSLSLAWRQDSSTKKWISDHVLTPGFLISDALIDAVTKQNFINILHTKILSNFIPTSKSQAYLRQIDKIPSYLTIKQYRDQIILLCIKICDLKDDNIVEKLTRQIDNALCQALEPELKEKLNNSAIQFADTNWSDSIQDIHFCFAVNPGSRQLEIGEIYADGSSLILLDQKYWLFNQKWEFSEIHHHAEILDDLHNFSGNVLK